MQAAHASTTVRLALDALPYPERAVVKPGFFPDSLDGLEERFCLVSLDVDYEAATLEGLRYFWPRLSPGGIPAAPRLGKSGAARTGKSIGAVPRRAGMPNLLAPLCGVA